MKLREVMQKMRGADLITVGREGEENQVDYKYYAGLVHQGWSELSQYLDSEVEGLHPEMSKGLVIYLR